MNDPNVLIVMNLPSLDKYENAADPGAKIFVDSTLISRKVERDDVDVYYIPATKMAQELGVPTLANMIILGKVIKEAGVVDFEGMEEALKKVVSARKAHLIDVNLKAIKAGYDYE